ncbi:MAG: ferrous iron transporter B [Planctomycetota bacterium]|nr:ferrous iron transporter B [Planctomycetota bacterium]
MSGGRTSAGLAEPAPARIALIGNPNTGKTTVFNRLSGLRHKTSNFPGTTQEARVGFVHRAAGGGRAAASDLEIIDLPGVYSLELDQSEAAVCRAVLAGETAPRGEALGAPDAVCVVIDATNMARGLTLVGEALRRRLPMVVALNMMDLARRRGVVIDVPALEAALGCAVVACSARSGEGMEALVAALGAPAVPNATPPGDDDGLARWAEALYAKVGGGADPGEDRLTDRLDRGFTHPVLGVVLFAAIMAGLFWVIFALAELPMGWIEWLFAELGGGVERVLPEGLVREFVSEGVIAGIAGVMVFLPQICLLFFLISLLEDTGYLARAAFVMDRVLRPLGLPGHAFVPLLSSHACALPGIMATRAIPDRRERLATILVAPFMTCSARLPVYVLATSLLFPGEPLKASLAFVGAYALGMIAGGLSALLARRTILRGPSRPMALELPTYKLPSLRTALIATWDRGFVFLKQAGTTILAICVVLWWLGAFPHVDPPAESVALRERAAQVAAGPEGAELSGRLLAEADALESADAKARSFIGRIGRAAQPVFEPLGFDWQLTVGVMASFAAREVFVSTMAVVVAGREDAEDEGVLEKISTATREDGVTPVFTAATCWSVLVFYVLAMQCLPTLAVTAREAGGVRWALLQLGWMSAVAYAGAFVAYTVARMVGA